MPDDINTPTGGNGVPDGPIIKPADIAGPHPAAPRGSGEIGAAAGPPPENETEYERIERLKLNTDGAPHSGAISDDIAKILKEIKLPERHDFKGAADIKAPEKENAPAKPAEEKESEPEAAKPKQRDVVTALHTLKDDVQDIVSLHKISMVKATALEQDKKRVAEKLQPVSPGVLQRRRRTAAMLFALVIFVGLGLAALYGVEIVTQSRTAPQNQQYPSIIFAEQTETVPIDGTQPSTLKETIAQARKQSNSPLGAITRIVPTISTTTASGQTVTQAATTQQFLAALGVQAPAQLLRALGTTFFFGIHTVDINAPVFVIPVTSYDLAFSGMLAWEPSLDQDLAPAFDAVPALVTGPGGIPTARTFTDAVMLNYDVRELKDDSGKIVLYYSFPTPNILVIAESPNTFSEILSRLEARREL